MQLSTRNSRHRMPLMAAFLSYHSRLAPCLGLRAAVWSVVQFGPFNSVPNLPSGKLT